MVVIIEQGNAKIVAMPGVVVGISDEENKAIQESQIKHYRAIGDIPIITELTGPTVYTEDEIDTLERMLENY